MNICNFIIYDFETTGRYHKDFVDGKGSEPIQLAAVAVGCRQLKICNGGEFNELMRPLQPELADAEALKINKKNMDDLLKARHPQAVWQDFTTFVNKFNHKKNPYTAPIPVGYNINGFDNHYTRQLCKLYGPFDKEKDQQTLFSWTSYDLMDDIFRWTENSKCIPNKKLDTVRDWLGISREGGHDALVDVKQCAAIFIKFMKLYRKLFDKIKFENSMLELEPQAVQG